MEHQHEKNPAVVPLVDERKGQRIYDPRFWRYALIGGAVGALLFGWFAGGVAIGYLPLAGLGQIATGGGAVAMVAGGGVGLAVGGLAGALIALYRLPRRMAGDH